VPLQSTGGLVQCINTTAHGTQHYPYIAKRSSTTAEMEKFRYFVIHLRLKFNLILLPLFLFGLFVSGGTSFADSFLLQTVVLHVCMYGGVNALNSYYDKDDGPIGGLLHPPPVDESLFYFSWATKLLGFALTFLCPFAFTCWYLAGMFMSVAYSHPSIRLKSSPIGSAATVTFFQGFGAYCAGWIAGGVPVSSMITLKGMLGALGVQSMALGFYPLTQIYQYDSDKKHGDNTLAVALGIENSFNFSMVFLALGGFGCLVPLIGLFYNAIEATLLTLYITGLLTTVYIWAQNFDVQKVTQNFHILHRISLVNAGLFFFFTTGHLSGILP